MKKLITTTILGTAAFMALPSQAENYMIDSQGMHASVEFKIKHLGYSWLTGRFNDLSGEFSFDEANPEKATVSVEIDPASIDSNHAERDKHLRGNDFLDVATFDQVTFVSTASRLDAKGNGTLMGNLSLRGVTKPVVLQVTSIGAGNDPWGGYRRGFTGTTEIALKDFGIDYDLGPASQTVALELNVEGIKQ